MAKEEAVHLYFMWRLLATVVRSLLGTLETRKRVYLGSTGLIEEGGHFMEIRGEPIRTELVKGPEGGGG